MVFNLKKEWFEKIKKGLKTHEYRICSKYWDKRLEKLMNAKLGSKIEFACGYPKREEKNKWLLAKKIFVCIRDGLDTDLNVDDMVWDIEFELLKR